MANRELVVAVFADAQPFQKGMMDAAKATKILTFAVSEMAEKNVAAMTVQQEKLRALAAEYQMMANSAKKGSAEAVAASTLLANANRKLGVETLTAGKAFDQMTRKAVVLGRTLSLYVSLPIAAVGAAATKMFVDFQHQMSMLYTQAGAPLGEIQKQTNAVLKLAKTEAAQSPLELAQGLYHLESLGLRGSSAMRALKTSADAAALGLADMEHVATALGGAVVTDIKGTQNYTKAMGILDATIGAGNMKMEELASALSTGVLPAAKDVGLSLPEVGAALAVLTDRGMGAQMAATRLRMTFAMMVSPTDAAKRALSDLGIGSEQLAQIMRDGRGKTGLLNALMLLQAAVDRMPNKVKAMQDVLNSFGRGRSGAGIITLLNSLSSNVSSYQGKLAQIEAQSDRFPKSVAVYHETASYKIAHAWSSIKASMIQLGGVLAPYAIKLAQGLEGVVNAFQKLPPSVRSAIGVATLLFATLGPVLLVTGKIARSFIELGVIIKNVGRIMGLTSTKMVADEVAVKAAADTTAVSVGTKTAAAAATGAAAVETAAAAETTALETANVAASTLYTTLGLIAGIGAITVSIDLVRSLIGDYQNTHDVGTSQGRGGKSGEVLEKNGKYYITSASNASRGGPGGMREISKAEAMKLLGVTSSKYGSSNVPTGSDFSNHGGTAPTPLANAYGMANGRAKLLALAKSAIGTPYLWGGEGSGGFDCSGLVQWALANGLDMNLGRTTFEQFNPTNAETQKSAKPGDLVFTNFQSGQPHHVGIYAGNGMVIAAEGGPQDTNAKEALARGHKVKMMSVSDFGVGGTTVFQAVGHTAPYPTGYNPMADQLGPSVDLEAQTEARKKIAAAKRAAIAHAKSLIKPITQMISAEQTEVNAALSKGDVDDAMNATRKEIEGYHKAIASLTSDRKGKSKVEVQALDDEIKKLKNGLKLANAQLVHEYDQKNLEVTKELARKDTAQMTKFDANLNALNKAVSFNIPGVTTDYVSELNKMLTEEQGVLKSEISKVKGKLSGAKGKTKTALQNLLTKLVNEQTQVTNAFEQGLEQKVSDAKDAYQNALEAFDSAFSNVAEDAKRAFDDQTQAYVDNVLGPKYFQGKGQLTPLEAQLKAIQDAANDEKLKQDVRDATLQIVNDLSEGADLATLLTDEARVRDATEAIRIAKLQKDADAERAQADADYAKAVSDYTKDRASQERELAGSLDALKIKIDQGTGSFDELNSVLQKYGISLSGIDQTLFSQASAAFNGSGGLVDTTNALQSAFEALINWINVHTGSNITVTTKSPGGGSSDVMSYQDALVLASLTHKAIPMASGARVRGGRGGVLAMIGEGNSDELVMPLDGSWSGGSSGEVHIHFHGPVIGTGLEKAAKELMPHFRAEIQRNQRRNAYDTRASVI